MTTINGTSSSNTLIGTIDDDEIYPFEGDDVVAGGNGDDTYFYTSGDDVYSETSGEDKIVFNTWLQGLEWSGPLVIFYRNWDTKDNLQIKVYDPDNLVFITDQTPLISSRVYGIFDQSGILGTITIEDQLLGSTSSIEYLEDYSASSPVIDLSSIYMTTFGGESDDTIYGITTGTSVYDETIYAQGGDDTVYSGAGSDIVYGGEGADLLYGESGNDVLYGMEGSDYIFGGVGDDYIFGDYDGTEGYLGNDVIFGEAGDDWIEGGAGNDTIYGGDNNDVLLGGFGDDVIAGEAGNDSISGGAGNDVIIGGLGQDNLYGEGGSDIFAWNAPDLGVIDIVHDFSLAENDKIDISDLLSGYDPISDVITDFVQIVVNSDHSILSIDANGGGDDFTTIAYIYGDTGIGDEVEMLTNGNLMV